MKDDELKCDICNTYFTKKSVLIAHHAQKHSDSTARDSTIISADTRVNTKSSNYDDEDIDEDVVDEDNKDKDAVDTDYDDEVQRIETKEEEEEKGIEEKEDENKHHKDAERSAKIRCEVCDRNFVNTEALMAHNAAKHSDDDDSATEVVDEEKKIAEKKHRTSEQMRCEICDKDFGSQEALATHSNAKHKKGKHNKKPIQKKNKHAKKIFYGILILLVLIGFFFIYRSAATSRNVINPSQYDGLAKYLTEKGAIMYGTEWCSHCKAQKALFGDSFQYINYVDCDKQPSVCSNAGVTGYPAWRINGQLYPGTQSLEKLAQLTGYPLNTASGQDNTSSVTGVQTATLRVSGSTYILEPSIFKKDIPVRLIADINSMPGCSKVVTIPAFNLLKYVDTKDNIITFTPTRAGTFRIACSMSMYTGTFTVE